jgi:hypothetical protein
VTESTRAGRALYWVVAIVAVAALLWLIVAIPGWVPGSGRSRGPLILIGFVAAAFACFVAAAIAYAVLAIALEALGVQLKVPPRGQPDALGGDEERAAADSAVHAVWYVYAEEDKFDNTVNWGVPVALHASAAAAQADSAARSGPPSADTNPHGRYVVDGPVNLLALAHTGIAALGAVREFLRSGTAPLEAKRWYSPGYYHAYLKAVPLTHDEARRAHALRVWTVYYEDRFHMGPSRETFPVAVCLSAAEAEAEVARRGPVQSGADGYLAEGPAPLVREGARSTEVGADVVREVLRRAERGEAGPVAVVC